VFADYGCFLPFSLNDVGVRFFGHAVCPKGSYDFTVMQSYQEDVPFIRVELAESWWRRNIAWATELLGENTTCGRILLLIDRSADCGNRNRGTRISDRVLASRPFSGFPAHRVSPVPHQMPVHQYRNDSTGVEL
jgi:hypothetical protein